MSSEHKPEEVVKIAAPLSLICHLCFPDDDMEDEYDFGTKSNDEVVDGGERRGIDDAVSKNSNHCWSALLSLTGKEILELEADQKIKEAEVRRSLFQKDSSDQIASTAATKDSKAAKQVIRGRVRTKHGAKFKRRCSKEGCTKFSQKGGVCWRHGAKITSKRYNEEGRTKFARKGGTVSIKHGPIKNRQCTNEGCTNLVVNGGVCRKHGAKTKLCSKEGCPNQAKKGGVCIKHGAIVPRCSSEGCTKLSRTGGLCKKHGAKVRRCSEEGCTNHAVKEGVCWRHGANALVKGAHNQSKQEEECAKKAVY